MPPSALALTAKQLIAAQALAGGSSIVDAAKQAGTNEKTIDRWLKIPAFQAAQKTIKNDIYQKTVNSLINASTSAVEVLKTVALDTATPSSARVTAAKSILDLAHRMHFLDEVEERLKALEERANQVKEKQDED
jgi:transposase-like protein